MNREPLTFSTDGEGDKSEHSNVGMSRVSTMKYYAS